MRKIAHIINPFPAPAGSDLILAQPVTFASMREAKARAAAEVEVELWSTQSSKDPAMVPPGFHRAEDLQRSVQDFGEFQQKREYPLIADILQALYRASEAEYLIFTNVDIAVMPDFYLRVNQLINEGHDSLIINRRRIPAIYNSEKQLPEMYKVRGKSHPGFDCFVFHRSLFPQFHLEHVCIGVPFIGILMAQNLFGYSQNCRLIRDEHLSFHIGMEIFKKRAPREYFAHNRREFWHAIAKMWPDLDSRKFPFGRQIFPLRWIRWGLHPSLPIRLGLALERRRWTGQLGHPPKP